MQFQSFNSQLLGKLTIIQATFLPDFKDNFIVNSTLLSVFAYRRASLVVMVPIVPCVEDDPVRYSIGEGLLANNFMPIGYGHL